MLSSSLILPLSTSTFEISFPLHFFSIYSPHSLLPYHRYLTLVTEGSLSAHFLHPCKSCVESWKGYDLRQLLNFSDTLLGIVAPGFAETRASHFSVLVSVTPWVEDVICLATLFLMDISILYSFSFFAITNNAVVSILVLIFLYICVFIYLFIYIYGCVGSLLLHTGFL